jgi:hypothetical protein
MNDMLALLGRWQLDAKAVREHMYRAPTPWERERWHAIWLLARAWSAVQVAKALERDAHTIGDRAACYCDREVMDLWYTAWPCRSCPRW